MLLLLTACLPNNEPDDPLAAQREQLALEEAEAPAEAGSTTSQTPPLAEVEDPDWASLDLELFPIVELDQPVGIADRSGSIDLWVAQRPGLVTRVERTVSTRLVETIRVDSTPVLDLSAEVSTDGENGLLNLAFSADGRSLYVFFTDLANDIVVSSFSMTSRGRADPDSRRDLLRIPRSGTKQAGGGLAVGPDGYLYIGLGDGGGAGDPDNNAQNLSSLLGSVLRIDPTPDAEAPYLTPANNPFADSPETWLYGVRNPWRLSFDAQSGDLWLADVGEDTSEEVNLLSATAGGGSGANLGWNIFEGDTSYEGGAPPADYQAPYIAYAHEDGRCSVTGGAVYRGETLASLSGVYVFADYCSGEIFGLQPTEAGPVFRALGVNGGSNSIVSFNYHDAGELYLVSAAGQISRLQPKPIEVSEDS